MGEEEVELDYEEEESPFAAADEDNMNQNESREHTNGRPEDLALTSGSVASSSSSSGSRQPVTCQDGGDEDEDGEIIESSPPPAALPVQRDFKKTKGRIIKTHSEALERLLTVSAPDWTKILLQLKIIIDARNREPMKLETLQKILSVNDEIMVALMYWCRFMCRPSHIIEDHNIKKLFAICNDLTQENQRRLLEITTREEQVLKDSQRKKRADEVDGGRGEITAGAVRPLHMQNNTSIPLTAEQERARAEEAERREKEEQEKRDFRNATAFLLFKALPTDTTAEELVQVIRIKAPSCAYITPNDIILQVPTATSESIKADVTFKKIRDAREAKKNLVGQLFGGFTLEIDYSLGRPNRTIWVGGVSSATTDEALKTHCATYGVVERIEVVRKAGGNPPMHGLGNAFVTFATLSEATAAVEGIKALGRLKENVLKAGYATSEVGLGKEKAIESKLDARGLIEHGRIEERRRADSADSRDRPMPPLDTGRRPMGDREWDDRDRGREMIFQVPPADRAEVEDAMARNLRYFLVTRIYSIKDIDDIHATAARIGPHTRAYMAEPRPPSHPLDPPFPGAIGLRFQHVEDACRCFVAIRELDYRLRLGLQCFLMPPGYRPPEEELARERGIGMSNDRDRDAYRMNDRPRDRGMPMEHRPHWERGPPMGGGPSNEREFAGRVKRERDRDMDGPGPRAPQRPRY